MKVQVHPYNPDWPRHFEALQQRLWPAVSHLATAIEHVGSTAVPGLPAKPILDVDIVIPTRQHLSAITAALADLGYQYRGNQGIPDRDAYRLIEPVRTQHLYVCPADSLPLHNHLALRDHLRANPNDRDAYARLKFELAQKFPNDIDSYIAGKTDFILKILAQYPCTKTV
jgi:GrpB-like predicted nucleotidyltransferase (UPF0157 family)